MIICHYNLPVISHNDSFHHCNEVSWKNSSLYQSKESWLSFTSWRSSLQKTVVRWGWKIQGSLETNWVATCSWCFPCFFWGVWTEFFVAQNFSLARHSPQAQKKITQTDLVGPWSAVDTNLDFARLFCTNTWNERKHSIRNCINKRHLKFMSEQKYPKKKNLKTIYKMTPRSPENHILTTMFGPKKNTLVSSVLQIRRLQKKNEMKVGEIFSRYSIYIYTVYHLSISK